MQVEWASGILLASLSMRSRSVPPWQYSRIMKTCWSSSKVSTSRMMPGWSSLRRMVISSQMCTSSSADFLPSLVFTLMATWMSVSLCLPARQELVCSSPWPGWSRMSYCCMGWPCVWSMTPLAVGSTTDRRTVKRFPSRPTLRRVCFGRCCCGGSPLACCASAYVSRPSMSCRRSPSMVPTKRSFRLRTLWMQLKPGLMEPMYMAGPP
mmetsp:Transcript_109031/g.338650  ORF Transcript_109031/g.338650 Transcript_109031/m.338650 type:complete len:208 (-) Transcript_109031:250-873(-)